jgi:hypothetical protein
MRLSIIISPDKSNHIGDPEKGPVRYEDVHLPSFLIPFQKVPLNNGEQSLIVCYLSYAIFNSDSL